jgi:hypothetical protein
MKAGRFVVASVVAVAIGLGALLPAGARNRATQSAAVDVPQVGTLDRAAAEQYAAVLAETTLEDLALPAESVPDDTAGVLGSTAEALDRLHRFLEYRRAVATAVARGQSTDGCNGDFACFKPCTLEVESHGNYATVSPDGTYRGAWQFDQRTWNGAVARAGYPEWSNRDPAQAPPHVQDAAARQLYAERGNRPWGGRC